MSIYAHIIYAVGLLGVLGMGLWDSVLAPQDKRINMWKETLVTVAWLTTLWVTQTYFFRAQG